MTNIICWLDLPVKDLDRAITFYSQVLDRKIEKYEYQDSPFGVLEHKEGEVGACLICSSERFQPKSDGPLVYFNVNARLDEALAIAKQKGGRIEQEKHSIGPHGFRAIIIDTEGNRIALHSESAY